jgi:hypothetical protein
MVRSLLYAVGAGMLLNALVGLAAYNKPALEQMLKSSQKPPADSSLAQQTPGDLTTQTPGASPTPDATPKQDLNLKIDVNQILTNPKAYVANNGDICRPIDIDYKARVTAVSIITTDEKQKQEAKTNPDAVIEYIKLLISNPSVSSYLDESVKSFRVENGCQN